MDGRYGDDRPTVQIAFAGVNIGPNINMKEPTGSEDVPENTMFVITTDGQENASHRYTSEQVKKMIERQKEKYGWEFLFIGANIDAVETAARYGISRDRAVNYSNNELLDRNDTV